MTNQIQYNYRVDLRPLGPYFFGGEVTFGNGEEVNYFAKSRPYPQQTTLLGVLRHLGYQTAGIGPADIGESFAAEADESNGYYGFIKAISPLVFRLADQDHLLGPLMAGAQSAGAPVAAGAESMRWSTGTTPTWRPLYELPTFNPKEWYDQPLVPGTKELTKLDDLVDTDTRIGITKQRDGAERTDGFYKQEFRTLKNSATTLSYYARLTEQAKLIDSPLVLPIGAEKQLFEVDVSPLALSEQKTFGERFPTHHFADCRSATLHCAVLLSDAFAEPGLLETLPFAVADTVDFRYLSTPVRVSDFGRLSRTDRDAKRYPDQIRQSRKYNLLARGSLLYAEEEQHLIDLLDHPRWQTIGYNHYHLLSPQA